MDLAALAVKVDASEAGKAATELDKLTAAGKRSGVTVEQAERHMRKATIVLADMAKAERTAAAEAEQLAKSTRGAGQAAAEMARDAQKSAAATKQITGMSNAAAFASRNLGYQLSDVVTQLASGTPPMRVFAQQGFQIVDALTMMRAEAAKTGQSMTSMITGSVGKAGPAILAIAIAAAAVGTALKIMQDDLNETGKVTLSYSDVALGAFDAVRAFTVDQLGPAFTWLAEMAGAAWGYIAAEAKRQANFMISVMVAVPNLIYAAFTTLPQAIAELFVNMANGAIKAVEDLVNKAGAGLNSFANTVNGLLGTSIGTVGSVSFGRIENSFEGAGKRAGLAMGKALTNSFGDHVGSAEAYVRPFAEARHKMGAAAEKAGKAAGARGGKAAGKAAGEAMADEWAKALEELAKDTSQSMAGLNKGLDKLVEDLLKASDADFDKTLKEIGEKVPQIATDTERWNAQLERTIGYLSQMGGAAGVLGKIGAAYQGLLSGDFSGVGGSIGSFLGQLNETQAGNEFLTGFRGTLDDFFGGAGKFTEALGAFGLAVSANQMIGDIFGFKGGPLGVFTSLVESIMPAKKGRATFSGGLDYTVTGNSGQREDAVGSLADNITSSLKSLADALGATVSGITGTISIRDNSLRYDPTGQGITKTSKGAIDFGQDEAALLERVISDAFANGSFEGLSEGTRNYLASAAGDLEQRIADVLSLNDVMNEAAQMRDPQAFALGELDTWRTSMLAIATATGEGMADVEYVYGERRKEILETANDNALELERDRSALLIQIAELEGRSSEALAMARQLELAEMDASLHPLMQRVYALQDEANTAALVAQNQAKVAEWARNNNSLVIRLYELEGRSVEALALRRSMELEATEESLRPLLARIFALEDEATATATANEATRQATELARSIADERFGLETRLLQLQGDTAALRQRELDALDPANRALLQLIFSMEDMQAAAQAEAATAAQAAQDLADAAKVLADAAKEAADEAARYAASVESENYGLTTRLLQMMGDTATLRLRELRAIEPANSAVLRMIFSLEDFQATADAAATAAANLATQQKAISGEAFGLGKQWLEATGQTDKLRELTLLGLQSDEARAIQKQIWTYEDMQAALKEQESATDGAADAAKEYADRLKAAQDTLKDAYAAQRQELEATRDKFSEFASTLRNFRLGLIAANDNPIAALTNTRADFMANRGSNPTDFIGSANSFLDASRGGSATRFDYMRDVAVVASAAEAAERKYSNQASTAQLQIKALQDQVGQYVELTEAVVTVRDAIAALEAITAEGPPVISESINEGLGEVVSAVQSAADRTAASEAMILAALEAIARSTGSTDNILRILENGGALAVNSRTGDTITTVAA